MKRALSRFRPDPGNANRHTERGMGMLEQSIRAAGWGDSITVDRNGIAVSGSGRLETAAVLGAEDLIVVESDGTKPIVHVRTDLDMLNDEGGRAHSLAVGSNRAPQVNLDWDASALLNMAGAGLDLTGFWREDELTRTIEGMNELVANLPDLTGPAIEPPAADTVPLAPDTAETDRSHRLGNDIHHPTVRGRALMCSRRQCGAALITRWKRDGWEQYEPEVTFWAHCMAKMAAECMRLDDVGPWERVTFPPSSKTKGRHLAEFLAARVADELGIPCIGVFTGGRKIRSNITAKQRLTDVPILKCDRTDLQTVLLVDDVKTTGTTITACAEALPKGCEVYCIALSRN
jgi:hypothetical protein